MARLPGRHATRHASGRDDAARDAALEALVIDRYLESLLDRGPLGDDPLAGVPADLRDAADALRSGLPRLHPSFRFEEDLAARLLAVAEGRTGELVAFPVATATAARLGDVDPRRAGPVRPVVLGGVLTSAALSLVGAAYVAWRRHRAPTGAMPRAVRAVARARTA